MLSAFAARVHTTIAGHNMLRPDHLILAGVSGGADSVSLALVLVELGYRVAVAHLNHGLRGESSNEDERFTRSLAERLGLAFYSERTPVQLESGNLEAAGRAARKAFFLRTAAAHGFTRIALAHTRDDRVETFLMNLFRGAGLDGLVSMAPVSGMTVRPLLDVSRAEVEAYLEGRGEPWRTDTTNLDINFTRNRLRHKVIPMLASEFNPRLAESIARTVKILDDDDAWLRAQTEAWFAEHAAVDANNVILDVEALRDAPTALLRRIVRLALRKAGSSLQEVSFGHIEGVASLIREGKSGKSVQLPGGLAASRNFGQLLLGRPLQKAGEYSYELQIPGHVRVPELGKTFKAWIVGQKDVKPAPDQVFVDGGSLGACVKIRNWKPGDYYRPAGLPAGKLKKLFNRSRIPRSQRGSWPVLVANSTIVWVASFPVSREFAPDEHSQKIVAFEASPS
jgi:tRNA(Ile)-lysidine synthase